MTKTKLEEGTGLRTPKAKKSLGLVVPPALRLPHDDLIAPRATEVETPSMPSQTTPPSLTRHTQGETLPIAPERDFMKTANSIVREAVPGGLFRGKSKQLYDALYLLTRGAVVPS